MDVLGFSSLPRHLLVDGTSHTCGHGWRREEQSDLKEGSQEQIEGHGASAVRPAQVAQEDHPRGRGEHGQAGGRRFSRQ